VFGCPAQLLLSRPSPAHLRCPKSAATQHLNPNPLIPTLTHSPSRRPSPFPFCVSVPFAITNTRKQKY
ncbi:hypothetical protein AMATHDRAFT_61763, partial [Amanita thiersii Skay4041]